MRIRVKQAEQQTRMTHLTIPDGYYGLMFNSIISNTKKTGGIFNLKFKTREFGKSFLTKGDSAINPLDAPVEFRFDIPMKFEPKTDIRIEGIADANGLALHIISSFALYKIES